MLFYGIPLVFAHTIKILPLTRFLSRTVQIHDSASKQSTSVTMHGHHVVTCFVQVVKHRARQCQNRRCMLCLANEDLDMFDFKQAGGDDATFQQIRNTAYTSKPGPWERLKHKSLSFVLMPENMCLFLASCPSLDMEVKKHHQTFHSGGGIVCFGVMRRI